MGSYLYNAFEQRVQKAAGSTTTQFVYDRAGHLLEEANASGASQREYIWLDDLPVAMVDDTGSSPVLYYIHTDQLGTPQKITDGSANVVWDGVFDPFGNAAATQGTNWNAANWAAFDWAAIALGPTNLRFPGQYADAETGLNQNWNRDYDPTIGRYVQSDPLGLDGGIDTYSYVAQNPLRWSDHTGKGVAGSIIGGLVGAAVTAEGGPAAIAGAIEGCETGSGAETAAAIARAASAASSNCPNPDDCEKRYAAIDNLVNELKKRGNEIKENPLGLPPVGPFSVAGHQQQFVNKQRQLQRLLKEANTAGCLGYRVDAWYYATRPTPSPL